jgi:hypothetical protein
VVEGSYNRKVADGRDRLRWEERYREREVHETVRKRHERELGSARGLGWVLASLKMRRELREELEALAPKRGSYLRSS